MNNISLYKKNLLKPLISKRNLVTDSITPGIACCVAHFIFQSYVEHCKTSRRINLLYSKKDNKAWREDAIISSSLLNLPGLLFLLLIGVFTNQRGFRSLRISPNSGNV